MLKHIALRVKSLWGGRHAIPKIRMKDLPQPQVLIVSYPKCGRTWLRLLIGRYLCQQYKLHPKLALETLYLTHHAGLLPTNFSHDGSQASENEWKPVITDKQQYSGKHVILLMRDPRDVAISCFFQATKRDQNYQGSISDFIRDPEKGAACYLRFLETWEKNAHVPKAFMVMRYKEIYANPNQCLRDALSFIGCTEINDELVEEAVLYASFSNMRKLDATRYFNSKRLSPGDMNDIESYKVRRGKIGGYRDYLNEEDCEYLNMLIQHSPCKLLDPYRQETAIPAMAKAQ